MGTTTFFISFCVLLSAVVGTQLPPVPFITPMDRIGTEPKLEPRIINGNPATPGQFPWQAAIHITRGDGMYLCGGSLINARFILTAAHCVKDAQKFTVMLGSISRPPIVDADRVSIETTEYFYHKDYNTVTLANDIALIRLPSAVTLNAKIAVIALAAANNYLGAGQVATVTGWGAISDGAGAQVSTILNYVELDTIANSDCGVFASTITTGTLCCRGRPNHSTCGVSSTFTIGILGDGRNLDILNSTTILVGMSQGDSGGGLVQRNNDGTYTHVGVVSFVHIDGCSIGHPSGYIRTSSFREWIDQNVNNFATTVAPPQATTPSAATSIQISQFLCVVLACVLKRIVNV